MHELNRAIFEEDLININRILESGCTIDFIDSTTGKTPLMQAVEQENIRIIELLLEYGASINATGFNRWTPLHLAVDIAIDGTVQSNGKQGTEPTLIIEFLIKKGADLNSINDRGETPIDVAKKYKSKKIVECLEYARP